MRRIAATVATEITATFLSGAGVAEDATGTVTVAITDGDGAAVASGNATSLGAGVYGYTVDIAILDTYTAVFSGAFSGDAARTTSTTFEVVGRVPMSVADIRSNDEDLADIVKYPANVVEAELQAAWDILDQGLQVAMVPRAARETHDGTGRNTLTVDHLFPREVIAATAGGSAVTGLVPKRHGVIVNPAGWAEGDGNVQLHYTHGWDTPPDPVLAALRTLTIDRLIPRSTPSRATSVSTDVGAFRLTIAGRDGYTGIPDVDAVIDQFGYAAAVGFG